MSPVSGLRSGVSGLGSLAARWAVLAWVVAVVLWHSRELMEEEEFEQTTG